MTNKPMLSVECELLQSALNAVEYLALRGDDIGLSNEPVAKELRALLDKQSCGACGGCDNGCKLDRESPQVEPASPHQGEPVAYLYRNIRHTLPSMRTQWEPITVEYARARMHNKALAAEGKAHEYLLGDEFQPLYAEQPAPVATIARLMEAVHAITGFPGVTGTQLRQLAEYLNGVKP